MAMRRMGLALKGNEPASIQGRACIMARFPATGVPMADLFALSNAVIDEGKGMDDIGPINRINHQLSPIDDGIAVVEAFSHCVLFETDDGLVAFDTSNPAGGARVSRHQASIM